MNKWILVLFVSLMAASVAQAATPTGADGSTDTSPLRNTPELCDCQIRADNNVNVGQGSDAEQRGEPIKAKVRDAFNLKNDGAPQNTKAVKDSDAG